MIRPTAVESVLQYKSTSGRSHVLLTAKEMSSRKSCYNFMATLDTLTLFCSTNMVDNLEFVINIISTCFQVFAIVEEIDPCRRTSIGNYTYSLISLSS